MTKSWMILPVLLTLVACGGGNPTKSSNPTKGYTVGKPSNSLPLDPDRGPLKDAPKVDNSQDICLTAFKVRIQENSDPDDNEMKFEEGKSKTYNVIVTNLINNSEEFTLKSVAAPEGVRFQQTRSNGDQRIYQLTWAPSKYRRNPHITEKFKYTIESADYRKMCPRQEFSGLFTLTVTSTNREPEVKIEGLGPRVVIDYDVPEYSFKVKVTDEAATRQLPPQLGRATFNDAIRSGEREVIDASHGVICGSARALSETQFVYNCVIYMRSIPNVDKFLDTNSEVTAAFYMQATSARGYRLSSNLTPGIFKLRFLRSASPSRNNNNRNPGVIDASFEY